MYSYDWCSDTGSPEYKLNYDSKTRKLQNPSYPTQCLATGSGTNNQLWNNLNGQNYCTQSMTESEWIPEYIETQTRTKWIFEHDRPSCSSPNQCPSLDCQNSKCKSAVGDHCLSDLDCTSIARCNIPMKMCVAV